MVLALGTTDVARRAEALASLCDAYWYPVYAFVRRLGHAPEDAADLTQAFFVHVLEKKAFEDADPGLGRFRSYVLASVRHFLINEWQREAALKRGGGQRGVPFEPAELERRYVSVRSTELDPEQLFDRQWAATVLERALCRLGAQQASLGRGREFAALSPFLTSEAAGERPYRAVAAELGTTETAVRAAVHRLRQRLGSALREEVSDTVGNAAAADAELRHLLGLLT
jgi:RNA polymerase sigma-70 factor (ECF subfamily)